MYYRYLPLVLLCIISCKTTEISDNTSELSPEMYIQKGPCFGKCPVYELTIYKGGMVTYKGKQFVEKFGTYTKKLSDKEYRAVKRAFEKADLWSLEDFYSSNVSDIPKTKISFTQKEQTKMIVGDMNRPAIVKELEKLLISIADSDGWTLQSIPDKEYPENFITDELLISVKEHTNIREWVNKYPDWKFEIVKEIGNGRNLYLLKYDNTKFKPALVMNTLSLDEDLKSVEFNKKVSGRR